MYKLKTYHTKKIFEVYLETNHDEKQRRAVGLISLSLGGVFPIIKIFFPYYFGYNSLFEIKASCKPIEFSISILFDILSFNIQFYHLLNKYRGQ
jgi:hypothetical protein